MNKRFAATALMIFGFYHSANADVWRWTDPNGNTHFVDTNRPIFTWRDEAGKVHFSDKPEHIDAVSVELIWHSTGTLADTKQEGDSQDGSGSAYPGETAEEKAERETAEAYYCKRAKEIYDSYVNAPRLYKTSVDGERVFLSDEETAQTIVETEAKVGELCN